MYVKRKTIVFVRMVFAEDPDRPVSKLLDSQLRMLFPPGTGLKVDMDNPVEAFCDSPSENWDNRFYPAKMETLDGEISGYLAADDVLYLTCGLMPEYHVL